VLGRALGAEVTSEDRDHMPRFIIMNMGSVRFDLHEGPFTNDDVSVISPFNSQWRYFPDVPYQTAMDLLNKLSIKGANVKKRDLFGGFEIPVDDCIDPVAENYTLKGETKLLQSRKVVHRQVVVPWKNVYTTKDDFGDDGESCLCITSPPNSNKDKGGHSTDMHFFSLPQATTRNMRTPTLTPSRRSSTHSSGAKAASPRTGPYRIRSTSSSPSLSSRTSHQASEK